MCPRREKQGVPESGVLAHVSEEANEQNEEETVKT